MRLFSNSRFLRKFSVTVDMVWLHCYFFSINYKLCIKSRNTGADWNLSMACGVFETWILYLQAKILSRFRRPVQLWKNLRHWISHRIKLTIQVCLLFWGCASTFEFLMFGAITLKITKTFWWLVVKIDLISLGIIFY